MWLGRTTLIVVVSLLAILAGASAASAFVVTFDGLPAGTTYQAGDTFSNGGLSLSVVNLGGVCGSSQIVNSNLANGAPNEMLLNCHGLSFNASHMGGVGFQYFLPAGTGGVALEINGLPRMTGPNFPNQTFGNVQVFTTSFTIGSGTIGSVFMTGPISSLMLGGYGLHVDNIIGCVPEPVTLGLMAVGGLLVSRRRK
jgi:hypothetical protein